MWPDARPFVVLAPQHDDPADDTHYAAREQGDLGTLRAGFTASAWAGGRLICMTPTEFHGFFSYVIAAYHVDPECVLPDGSELRRLRGL